MFTDHCIPGDFRGPQNLCYPEDFRGPQDLCIIQDHCTPTHYGIRTNISSFRHFCRIRDKASAIRVRLAFYTLAAISRHDRQTKSTA